MPTIVPPLSSTLRQLSVADADVLAPFVEVALAQALAAEQDLRFLHEHRDQLRACVAGRPDVLATVLRANAGCGPSCQVRRFWMDLAVELHGAAWAYGRHWAQDRRHG